MYPILFWEFSSVVFRAAWKIGSIPSLQDIPTISCMLLWKWWKDLLICSFSVLCWVIREMVQGSSCLDQKCKSILREGVKKNRFFWILVPNIGPHPPTAHVWDSTKWKVKVKFILLFRLFRAFYFFCWKNEQFFGQNSMYLFGTLDWVVIFTKKFGTLDLHLPIVWDKVPKKNVFFGHLP